MQGQFYAISADHAAAVLDELRTGTSRTDIGLTLIHASDIPFEDWYGENAETAISDLEEGELTDALYVVDVAPGSAAAKAGIRPGHMIKAVEGVATTEVGDVCGALQSRNAGELLRFGLVNFDDPDQELFLKGTVAVRLPQ